MKKAAKNIWLVTGSQHLYGPDTLAQVAKNASTVGESLSREANLPVAVVVKSVVTTPEEIFATCQQANNDKECVGIIFWMHTFSPAKMWIRGLKELQKPFCHLHTQFHRDIPWAEIDMDYMNLHQSAHGDREFGHICARLKLRRKVITGHWQEKEVQNELAGWCRAALGFAEMKGLKVVRFGDNMRSVAVTEGDKVEAELQLGCSVNTHGIGDLVDYTQSVTDADITSLCEEYETTYKVVDVLKKGGEKHDALREAARIELGLRKFLTDGGYGAFTDTFEDLHGLNQLPGIAAQRLMASGYGFGAEGDWKHAALLRVMKTMAEGLSGGTSFMEDYTYHFHPSGAKCLGAHMLEICPSIASSKPSCEIHPLGIGGKSDPVRLVFDGAAGPAIAVSLVDMGDRFRLVVNEVNAMPPDQKLPRLPVARTLWEPLPDLRTAATAWILAGGAHHTSYSLALNTSIIEDLSEMMGLETVIIDAQTNLREFRNHLRLLEGSSN